MNKKRRTGCRISALLMAVILTCGASMGALAAETEAETAVTAAMTEGTKDLDMNQKGSIFVALVDEEGIAMTGGSLGVYQIAEVGLDDWNMVYTCTEAFADWFAENETELNQETLEDGSVAEALAEWAAEQDVATVREVQVQNGEVTFSDLPLGVYLVVQTKSANGFYDIDPFFVTLPHMEDGVWVYGVDASPKVEVNPEPQTDTEPHTESSESEPQSETKEKESEKTSTPGGTTTGGTSGTGTSGESTTSEKLPQTGQLNWPIPLLALGGLLLILVGGALMLSDRRKKNHAA